MSGKYLSKFAVSFFVCIACISFGKESDNSFSINGFDFDHSNEQYTKALRLQGIGDFFFKSKSYAQSLLYYEQALDLLPKEADITFRLAEIYQYEKLWLLSELYYTQTIELLKDPVNQKKSQLNSYISQIRIVQLYHLQNNPEKARELVRQIRLESSVLKSLYPDAWKELSKFDNLYPEIAIRQDI